MSYIFYIKLIDINILIVIYLIVLDNGGVYDRNNEKATFCASICRQKD